MWSYSTKKTEQYQAGKRKWIGQRLCERDSEHFLQLHLFRLAAQIAGWQWRTILICQKSMTLIAWKKMNVACVEPSPLGHSKIYIH